MKIFKEILIIFSISMVGEFISGILPFSFPSSIIALGLMLIVLCLRVVKEEDISTTGDFLLSTMAFFFIPASVKILELFELLKSVWVQIVLISLSTTIITFFVTGWAVELTIRLMEKRRNGKCRA